MRVVFSFDDATAPDLEVANLLLQHGFEANTTFYFPVMPTTVNEPRGRQSLTYDQQCEIASEFEIGSHTITHQLLTRIPLDYAKPEIFDSKKLLEQKFDQPINKFSYPRGYANPDIQKLVADAGYKSARSTLVGYIMQSENPFFEQTAAHVGCNRKEYGGKSWYDYALYMLEQAKNTPNSIYHLWGHGFEIQANNAFGDFKKLLDILRSSV